METCFLHLWTLLEQLTATSLNAPHTTTIKRAAFIFAERETELDLLEHLRQCRNVMVHRAQPQHNAERLVYQLKRYVEELMTFHLSHGSRFASMRKVGDFFDLPPDRTDLNRALLATEEKARDLRQALRFKTK